MIIGVYMNNFDHNKLENSINRINKKHKFDECNNDTAFAIITLDKNKLNYSMMTNDSKPVDSYDAVFNSLLSEYPNMNKTIIKQAMFKRGYVPSDYATIISTLSTMLVFLIGMYVMYTTLSLFAFIALTLCFLIFIIPIFHTIIANYFGLI